MKKHFENWLVALQLSSGLLVFVWVVAAFNQTVPYQLNRFGLYPRETEALTGLFFWIWLHADFNHLLLNSTPLMFLGFFTAIRGPKLFCKISLTVWLLTGVLVWLFARPAFHIGTSALIFGYFGFLLAVAVYERSLFDLGVASLVIFYYGGLFFGVLPTEDFISWESHLFGLISGGVAARVFGQDWVAEQKR